MITPIINCRYACPSGNEVHVLCTHPDVAGYTSIGLCGQCPNRQPRTHAPVPKRELLVVALICLSLAAAAAVVLNQILGRLP